MLNRLKIYGIIVIILVLTSSLYAEEKGKSPGMPPAKVVVSEVTSGMVAPESEFIGTVYYQEVSDVASEVQGKVEKVNFEEGQRVRKGHVLASLSSDLLKKTLQATRASYEQILSDLDQAKRNLERSENLFQSQLVTEQDHDDRRFTVSGLEKRAISLKADVERLEVELDKKSVRSPFDGIVLKKHVDRGEWLDEGSTVATIALEDNVDIIAEVAEPIIRHMNKGLDVQVSVGGEIVTGKVIALIPRGDISTRTFPVKVRVKNNRSLVEGMEARVTLPTGRKEKTLIVPRDAVITVFGSTVVYSVNDSAAHMIPVEVVGYKGMSAGIRADGLKEGMKVVIKGNERLREGQPVEIQQVP
jgi:RND family efflux transporter MFP subunit